MTEYFNIAVKAYEEGDIFTAKKYFLSVLSGFMHKPIGIDAGLYLYKIAKEENDEEEALRYIKMASGINAFESIVSDWKEEGLYIEQTDAMTLLANDLLTGEFSDWNEDRYSIAAYLLYIAAKNGNPVAAKRLLSVMEYEDFDSIAEYNGDIDRV